MGEVCLAEKRVQPHRCLWEQNSPEAAQLCLVLKLRGERGSRSGNIITFDRWPHAALEEVGGR
jgi:hypothetical protein